MTPLLSVRDLVVEYIEPTGNVRVLDGVSLDIAPGEIIGLAGESGSGKSTVLRAIAGLWPLTDGAITCSAAPGERERRRAVQLIFQNPDSSLNPRHRVEEIIAQPLRLYFHMGPEEIRATAMRHLASVELDPRYLTRYPAQLSGGERQRVAIARSLANRPKVLIADEPTGNLDPNTSRVVFQNLFEIAKQEGEAVLVATHNVELTSVMDRVLTLHDGRLEPAPARAD